MTKGERIRALRREKGISQVDLAKHLNTTKQTISKYEKGIVTNIPSDKVEAMAILFNTTPQYILGWNEETEKPTDNGGLSKEKRELIDFVDSLPDEKVDLALRLLKSI